MARIRRICIDDENCIEISGIDDKSINAFTSVVMRGSNREWDKVVKELSDRLRKAFGDRLDRSTWGLYLLRLFKYFPMLIGAGPMELLMIALFICMGVLFLWICLERLLGLVSVLVLM
jgi:hypothetical protein